MRYTQQIVNEIEEMFQSQFNITSAEIGKYGSKKGIPFMSFKRLTQEQRKKLDNACLRRYGSTFKSMQSSLNIYIAKGILKAPGSDLASYTNRGDLVMVEESTPPVQVNQNKDNVCGIIKTCCRLLHEGKLNTKELCEIIDTL